MSISGGVLSTKMNRPKKFRDVFIATYMQYRYSFPGRGSIKEKNQRKITKNKIKTKNETKKGIQIKGQKQLHSVVVKRSERGLNSPKVLRQKVLKAHANNTALPTSCVRNACLPD